MCPQHKMSSVKIIRDNFGIPHIYAEDVYSLYYGYGYAVGQDRLFQMENDEAHNFPVVLQKYLAKTI